MNEFLKLAEELDNNPEPGAHQDGLNLMAAAALRKAVALQEAYTNLGSERDLLLLECDNLRGEIARLKQTIDKVRAHANQDREDYGVDMFQVELRKILEDSK